MTDHGEGGRWQAAMARVDADLLDCLAVNVAVLLADQGAADVRTPFAARWRFDPAPAGNERLRSPAAERHLEADLRKLAGQRLTWHRAKPTLGGQRRAWGRVCAGGRGVLVVADAFDLPWLPYAGHQHMEHSFVVTSVGRDELGVADGYTNATEWGRAEPVTTAVRVDGIDALLAAEGRWTVLTSAPPPRIDLGAVIRRNAEEIIAAYDGGRYDAFLRQAADQAAAGDLEPLSLQTWLLARSRGLHARWLADHAFAFVPEAVRQEFTASVVPAWVRSAELTYIGLRRARAGRAVPPSVTECLRQACSAEVGLARALRDAAGAAS